MSTLKCIANASQIVGRSGDTTHIFGPLLIEEPQISKILLKVTVRQTFSGKCLWHTQFLSLREKEKQQQWTGRNLSKGRSVCLTAAECGVFLVPKVV